MRQVEVIAKATDYGNRTLEISHPAYKSITTFRVKLIGYKMLIHFQQTLGQKVYCQQYWSFIKFGSELVYDGGYPYQDFLKRYKQFINDSQTKIKTHENINFTNTTI